MGRLLPTWGNMGRKKVLWNGSTRYSQDMVWKSHCGVQRFVISIAFGANLPWVPEVSHSGRGGLGARSAHLAPSPPRPSLDPSLSQPELLAAKSKELLAPSVESTKIEGQSVSVKGLWWICIRNSVSYLAVFSDFNAKRSHHLLPALKGGTSGTMKDEYQRKGST